jgi:hypothetical protein
MMKYSSALSLLGVSFKATPAYYEKHKNHIAAVSGAGTLVSAACCVLWDVVA